jgi:hypothetical protein
MQYNHVPARTTHLSTCRMITDVHSHRSLFVFRILQQNPCQSSINAKIKQIYSEIRTALLVAVP